MSNSRALLNEHKWEDIVREMHPEPAPSQVELTEKEEFARRQFGPVNAYVRQLEIENETLRRRVRVLEQVLAETG